MFSFQSTEDGDFLQVFLISLPQTHAKMRMLKTSRCFLFFFPWLHSLQPCHGEHWRIPVRKSIKTLQSIHGIHGRSRSLQRLKTIHSISQLPSSKNDFWLLFFSWTYFHNPLRNPLRHVNLDHQPTEGTGALVVKKPSFAPERCHRWQLWWKKSIRCWRLGCPLKKKIWVPFFAIQMKKMKKWRQEEEQQQHLEKKKTRNSHLSP